MYCPKLTINWTTNTATLSGTVSDDGLPNPPATVTINWSKTSGPGTVTFANSHAASTTATFSTTGSYVLQLDANDSSLHTDATVSIIVNMPPTVSAGSNQSVSMPTATLSGSVSDDGLPAGATTCLWTQDSGPGTTTFTNASAASTTATFTVAGTYVLRLTANDTLASTYSTVTITAGRGPYGGTAWPIPGKVEAENYDYGGQNVSYYDTTPGNGNGPIYRNDDVDIRATTDVGGGYLINYIAAGEWLEYTVNVATTANYNISVRTMTTNTGRTMHINCDGNNVTGTINLPTTADWDTGATTTVNTISLTAGQHIIRACMDTALFNFNWFDIEYSVTNSPPIVMAGSNQTINWSTNTATLSGSVSDDGRPNPPASCVIAWSKVSGPGTVTFANGGSASTTATFSTTGSYVLQLDANDSSLHTDATVSIIVNRPPTANAGSNQQITWPTNTVTVTGTVSDDGLPSGNLTTYWEMQSGPGTVLFANAGALSTTATFSTSGTYVLILTANDTAATGSGTCYVTVNPATEGPFGGTAWAVPCRIEAENYDVGGQNVAYYDTTSGNQNGSIYREDDVDIRSTTDTGGGYLVDYVAAGEWLQYTVNIPSTRAYDISVRTMTTNSGKTMHINCDGTNVTGTINIPTTADWDTGATTTVHNVTLTAGQHVMRVCMDSNLFNFNWFQIDYSNAAPTANAGLDQGFWLPTNTCTLSGSISDDGLPNPPATTTCTWSKDSGPGTVTFTNANAASTTATFSTSGTYVLRLTANDSVLTGYDTCTVYVYAAGAEGPYGGVPWAAPCQIEAENYDVGGQNVAYYDTTAGEYRPRPPHPRGSGSFWCARHGTMI